MTFGFDFRRWSLFFKILFWHVILVIVPLVIVGVIFFLILYVQVENNAENAAKINAELKSQQLKSDLVNLKDAGSVFFSNNSQVTLIAVWVANGENTAVPAPLQDALSTAWANLSSISEIRLVRVTETDEIVLAYQGTNDNDLHPTTRSFLYRRPTQLELGTIYQGSNNNPYIDIFFPLLLDDQVVGYVVITQDLTLANNDVLPDIYSVLFSQPSLPNLPDAYIALLNSDGELIGANQPRNVLFSDYQDHYLLQNSNLQNSNQEYRSVLLDEQVFGYAVPIEETDWLLIVEYSEEGAARQQFTTNLPILLGAFGVLVGLSVLLQYLLFREIIPPLKHLNDNMRRFVPNSQSLTIEPKQRYDEIGQLHNNYLRLQNVIQSTVQDFEKRLLTLNDQQEILYEINHLIRRVHSLEYLLEEFVRLLSNRIAAVAHAQIYLLEANAQVLTLHASSGEIGRRLISQGYNQDITFQSPITQATKLAQIIRARTVSGSIPSSLEKHPIEIAVPLQIEYQVIGVLDLFSMDDEAFPETMWNFLASIATIITLAIYRHQRDSQLQTILPTTSVMSRHLQQQPWREYFNQQRRNTFVVQAGQPLEAPPLQAPLHDNKPMVKHHEDYVILTIPVVIGDTQLGVVECTIESLRYHDDVLQTAQELVNRLALATDNARLFEQSQLLIERERIVSDITQKLSTHTDIRQILQTAVKELGQALGMSYTQISFYTDRRLSSEPPQSR